MRWRIQEVGIAERDVLCAGFDQLCDVGEHRILVEAEDTTVEHDRYGAVPAAVRATVRRDHRADESLLIADLESRVAIEGRQEVARRQRRGPVDRLREVEALRRIEPEHAHGPIDAVRQLPGQAGGGVHRHGERHLVGPPHECGVPRVDRHVDRAHFVAACAQVRGRATDTAGLLPEFVGRDEEDPHRARLRADLATS